MAPVKVLLVGHSFVKRAERDIKSNPAMDLNFRFKPEEVEVRIHGVGGRTARKIKEQDLHVIQRFSPEIVILEIGTNELAKKSSPLVAEDIKALVKTILAQGSVKLVSVNQVIFRQGDQSFNQRVEALNYQLTLPGELPSGAFFWKHVGLWFTAGHLLPDGVHLNPLGTKRIYRSWRGAMVKALKQVKFGARLHKFH